MYVNLLSDSFATSISQRFILDSKKNTNGTNTQTFFSVLSPELLSFSDEKKKSDEF